MSNMCINNQVVGPSNTGLGPLKQGLGFEPCAWKKLGWEGKIPLKMASQVFWRKLVIGKTNGYSIPITCLQKKIKKYVN